MDEERLTSLKALEARLGYEFKEVRWLNKALTHKSFSHQSGSSPVDPSDKVGNEVLEFLGDAVLGLAVTHLLFHKLPEANEGVLSQRRAHLVKRTSLASLSRGLQLEQHLLLGKGELLDGGKKKSSILANAFEALIGAIYLDSGFDRALEVIQHHFAPYLQSDIPPHHFGDFKSLLQEHTQRTDGVSPKYRVIRESGPDHDKRFQASVTILGEMMGIGWGKSKKEAEQEAAQKALAVLLDQYPNFR